MSFSSIPIRTNGDRITFDWFNAMRTEGIALALLVGGETHPFLTVTADYTLLSSDEIIFVDATAGPIEITFPPALGLGGKVFRIKKIDLTSNPVTLIPDGSDLLEFQTSQSYVSPGIAMDWVSDDVSNYFAL